MADSTGPQTISGDFALVVGQGYVIEASYPGSPNAVGGFYEPFSFDEFSYNWRLAFRVGANLNVAQATINIQISVPGAGNYSRTFTYSVSSSEDVVTDFVFIPINSAGTIEVLVSISMSGVIGGFSKLTIQNSQFFPVDTPPVINCDCCCCSE